MLRALTHLSTAAAAAAAASACVKETWYHVASGRKGEKHRQFLTFDQWDVHAADLRDLDAILGSSLKVEV